MDVDQQLAIGRIVHYRLEQGPNKGDYRPAIIVRLWSPPSVTTQALQLQVFVDGTNDGQLGQVGGTLWATSRVHGPHVGQWLWPNEPKFAMHEQHYQAVQVTALGRPSK